jgi:hypothetical protein
MTAELTLTEDERRIAAWLRKFAAEFDGATDQPNHIPRVRTNLSRATVLRMAAAKIERGESRT